VAVKSRGGICAKPVRGQKIEEHVVDLHQRNNENRTIFTSGAAAEEHQEVSSKNKIDELSEAITGGNDVGLWS